MDRRRELSTAMTVSEINATKGESKAETLDTTSSLEQITQITWLVLVRERAIYFA